MKNSLKIFWISFKKYWMIFAHKLGEINQTILLSIIFFIGFGLYGILLKLFKIIIFPFKKEPKTYWRDFEENQDKLEDLERLF